MYTGFSRTGLGDDCFPGSRGTLNSTVASHEEGKKNKGEKETLPQSCLEKRKDDNLEGRMM